MQSSQNLTNNNLPYSQINQPYFYQSPYPAPYPYEQPPIYTASNSMNFSNENSYENSDKSFLFAKSKKIANISPYKDIKPKEPQIADSKTFFSSPWGLKHMSYDNEYNHYGDFSLLKDVPENISGHYFKERKMYKNRDENLRSRLMINNRKKENSVDDEDFDLSLQHRPKRFLESLEKEKFQRKGRSVSPGNTFQINNQIRDQNNALPFLPCKLETIFFIHIFIDHVFSNSILVNVKVDFEEILKNFSLKLQKQTALKGLKDFIFRKRVNLGKYK